MSIFSDTCRKVLANMREFEYDFGEAAVVSKAEGWRRLVVNAFTRAGSTVLKTPKLLNK